MTLSHLNHLVGVLVIFGAVMFSMVSCCKGQQPLSQQTYEDSKMTCKKLIDGRVKCEGK